MPQRQFVFRALRLHGIRVAAILATHLEPPGRHYGEVVQFVPFHLRAWQAGESGYCDRPACNDFSIGIELEGTADGSYEIPQYQSLCLVVKTLCKAYPCLNEDKITGHSDIAPGRKLDPGPGFEWELLALFLQNPEEESPTI